VLDALWDWTFREAEVRLAEHGNLRVALGLTYIPDYTTLYRFLRRLDERALKQTPRAVVERLIPRLRSPATVAVDATGLTPGAISTFIMKHAKDRGPGFTWRHWLKWTMAVDVDRRLILAQRHGAVRPMIVPPYDPWSTPPTNMCPSGWYWLTRSLIVSGIISISALPYRPGVSYLPSGAAPTGVFRVRAQMRQAFPASLYRRRSLIESVISAVKRKLSARVPGRTLGTQCLQALLLGIAYNIYLL
jgi:hypothetical protein